MKSRFLFVTPLIKKREFRTDPIKAEGLTIWDILFGMKNMARRRMKISMRISRFGKQISDKLIALLNDLYV